MKKELLIVTAVIFFGFLVRLYLTLSLPIWLDEYYALRVLSHPLSQIITGVLDRAYPPGYYTLLKLWSYFSTSYIWLRFSTLIFFIFNSMLFYLIGNQYKNRKIGIYLVVLYTFSGYFVIFDWQFTVYSCLLTSILASYFLYNSAPTKIKMFGLVIVNLAGLFLHYGFAFYFLPLTAWSIVSSLTKRDKDETRKTMALIVSLIIYLIIWGKTLFDSFNTGIGEIGWIKDFIWPSFFVPFFLGNHTLTFFGLVFLALLIFGIYLLFKDKRIVSQKILVIIASFSLVFCMIFSYLVKPILHVRSLQIVGIAVLFLYAEGLSYLYRRSRLVACLFILIFILNCFFMVRNFPQLAGWYLIRFDKPI